MLEWRGRVLSVGAAGMVSLNGCDFGEGKLKIPDAALWPRLQPCNKVPSP